MSIQVLLMTDVKDLGAEGDVATVSEGYARNYLYPRKLAAPVTDAMRRRLAKQQRDREAASQAAAETARAMAARLQNVSVTIPAKTEEGGKLYGSVGASEIVDAIKAQGIELDRHTLELEHPIKELGVFDVKVRLHPDVAVNVRVWVVEE